MTRLIYDLSTSGLAIYSGKHYQQPTKIMTTDQKTQRIQELKEEIQKYYPKKSDIFAEPEASDSSVRLIHAPPGKLLSELRELLRDSSTTSVETSTDAPDLLLEELCG